MSTILKALRKIENEADADALSSLSWPGPVPARRKADERMRIRRIRIRALMGFSILILVFCGTWYFSHRSAGAPPPVVFREHAAPPPMDRSPSAGPVKKEIAREAPELVAAQLEKPTAVSFVPAAAVPPPRPAVISESELKDREVPELQPMQEDDPFPADPAQESTHDPRIDLQAIAWSPEPAESFAVINNRILHEGQSFDGITITRIGRDDVSFQEMGREWREDFRLK